MDISEVVLGKQVSQEHFIYLRDVMIIRYVHWWGGHPLDNKLWEGTINQQVEDWNSPTQLIKQAERKGIAWIKLRYHKNGKVSCVQKSK